MNRYNKLILLILFYFAFFCGACNNIIAKKTTANKINAEPFTNITTTNLIKQQIDFFAEGNQPCNWQLKINFNDTVRFFADDGLAVKFAFNQTYKTTETNAENYNVNLKIGQIKFSIFEQQCSIQKNNIYKQTTFTYNNKIYTGCGSYVSNPQLDGIWVLQKMKTVPIQETDFLVIPTLQINLQKNSLIGTDGCNNISTTIKVLGKQIQFGLINSTKKKCNKKDIADVLTKNISNKLVAYYFKNEKLHLYLNDDSELIFIKK